MVLIGGAGVCGDVRENVHVKAERSNKADTGRLCKAVVQTPKALMAFGMSSWRGQNVD